MARASRPVTIRGVRYSSAAEAAAALDVSAGHVRQMVKDGRADLIGTRGPVTPVTIRGVTYANFSAAAAALGVAESTVRAAARKGTLHRVGTGRVGPEPMQVRIAGVVYADVHDAARAHGVKAATVWAAICDGDPDRIARPPRYNPARSRPFRVGGLTFSSMREASRALGFKNEEYVAKVLKGGSKKGRERILAAAMRYSDRQGSQVSGAGSARAAGGGQAHG